MSSVRTGEGRAASDALWCGPCSAAGLRRHTPWIVDHTWEGVEVPAEPCVGERRATAGTQPQGPFRALRAEKQPPPRSPEARCSHNEWSWHGDRMAAVTRTKAHPLSLTLLLICSTSVC